ncbi:MAG TPA: hypothetical protein VLM85_09780 [Polyangiaceae bacterium]|nr:hypothetical protein [Polyangiaceae bacterium]
MRTRLMYGFAVLFFASACSDNSGAGDGGGDASPTPVDGGGQDVGQDVAIDTGGQDVAVDTGGQDVAVDTAPPCVTTKLPTEDACVVTDAEGIFVSASMGSLAGDGTMAKPMVSLQAGITAAKSANKRVYACAETYAEAITLQDGVSVFGYFDCANAWAVGTAHAKVQATTSPAAIATSVTSTTRVESVDFVAPDFTTGSQSSIALLASGSPGLQFVNDKFHAGTGGKGADGASGIQLVDSGTAKNGANAWNDGVCLGTICPITNYMQPGGGTNVCTGETGHDGGPGGPGGYPGEFQSKFVTNSYAWVAVDQGTTAGFPTITTSQTAQGGALGMAGSPGAAGAAGSGNGSPGANLGVISASGYAPSDGASGGDGAPGQGGGGSGGYYYSLPSDYTAGSYAGKYGWAEPGPGGGAGGCPGLAGQVGKGGGASIAIVAISSAFTLTGAVVESSAGGAAGAAGGSSTPTAGGNGGAPSKDTVTGGKGGAGGAAGVSGNGGGGPSIGLAYQGTSPTQSTTTITQGQGGAGVAQRVVNGQTIPASPSGLSQSTYSF